MAPKLGVAGGMLALTAAMPITQLLLFSSVASCIGAAGQGNYVAANAVLDGWAAAGRASGVALTAVQWGAWASAGMASDAVKRRLVRLGQGVLHPATGLAALAAVLRCRTSMASGLCGTSIVTVNPFSWHTYLSGYKPAAVPAIYEDVYASCSAVDLVAQLPAAARAVAPLPLAGPPIPSAWSQERIAAEVSTALQEILGRALEPDEPFMSGVN